MIQCSQRTRTAFILRDQGKASPQQLIQLLLRSAKGHIRLRDHLPHDRPVKRRFPQPEDKARIKPRLGFEFHLQQIILHRRKGLHCLHQLCAECDLGRINGHHHIPHDDRQLDHRPRRITAFLFITVKHRLACATAHDRGQFPRGVRRVAQTCVHPLPCKWGRQVRSVARQQDTAIAPTVGHACMECVDRAANDVFGLQLAIRGDQFPDEIFF